MPRPARPPSRTKSAYQLSMCVEIVGSSIGCSQAIQHGSLLGLDLVLVDLEEASKQVECAAAARDVLRLDVLIELAVLGQRDALALQPLQELTAGLALVSDLGQLLVLWVLAHHDLP